MLAATTFDALPTPVAAERLDPQPVKGREAPVDAHDHRRKIPVPVTLVSPGGEQ